jgi:hypothetical protein
VAVAVLDHLAQLSHTVEVGLLDEVLPGAVEDAKARVHIAALEEAPALGEPSLGTVSSRLVHGGRRLTLD